MMVKSDGRTVEPFIAQPKLIDFDQSLTTSAMPSSSFLRRIRSCIPCQSDGDKKESRWSYTHTRGR